MKQHWALTALKYEHVDDSPANQNTFFPIAYWPGAFS